MRAHLVDDADIPAHPTSSARQIDDLIEKPYAKLLEIHRIQIEICEILKKGADAVISD